MRAPKRSAWRVLVKILRGALAPTIFSLLAATIAGLSFFSLGPASTKLYSIERTLVVRVAAATCASLSMTSSFVAFYWFCRMEKRFRHRLIMLLIFGDLLKATWPFIFAIVSMARGTVYTQSAFCQSSGFLSQLGNETSDYAVLVIAIHSATQVFRYSNQLRSEGLYPYRHYVYLGGLVIPGTMAGLAFLNPHWGYMSQGAFCSLPIRPVWYRLALAWIPRYMVAIVILGLAIAIYAHVGFEFRSLSNMVEASDSTTTPRLSAGDIGGDVSVKPKMTSQHNHPSRKSSSVVSMIDARRASAVATLGSYTESLERGGNSYSVPGNSHSFDRNANQTFSPMQTHNNPNTDEEPRTDSSRNTSPLTQCPTEHVQRHLAHQRAHQRARIHRQLRLMFIYPIVYILMWIIPFVNQCMTYNDTFAAHPIYWISLLATICTTLMGTIDCLIFSLHERPWRHIPCSDGTFRGSFVCWRKLPTGTNGMPNHSRSRPMLQRALTEANPDTPYAGSLTQEPGWMSSVVRASRSIRMSGSSDQAKVQAEMARARLGFEREDRRAANAAMAAAAEASRGARRGTGFETIDSPGDEVSGFNMDHELSNGQKKTEIDGEKGGSLEAVANGERKEQE